MDDPSTHLLAVQNQSGDTSVKNILNATGKGRITNTTLNKLQNKLLSKERRIAPNEITNNREALIDIIQAKIYSMSTTTTDKAPHKKTKVVTPKKTSVKKITQKKIIEEKEVIPSTGEITVYRDGKQASITVEKPTDNVAGAIQVQLTGLDASDPAGKTTPIKDADTLVVPGNQATLIKQMQQMKVPGANDIQISKSEGILAVNDDQADPFIYNFFKDSFKQIRYNNKQMPKRGVDFHDLTKDEFVGTDPIISEQYAKQRKARDKKKQPAIKASQEDIAAAQAMGLSVSDYMKALNKDKAPAEIPEAIQQVADVHKNKARLDMQIAREPEVKALYKSLRKMRNVLTNWPANLAEVKMLTPEQKAEYEREQKKYDDLIEKSEFAYFKGDYGTANALKESAIQMIHERAEFLYPEFSVSETGEIKYDYDPEYAKVVKEGVLSQIKEATTEQKKERKPLASEVNEALIDSIIGKPDTDRKTKSKISKVEQNAAAKQEEQIKTNQELDSLSDEINNKLDDDLCI